MTKPSGRSLKAAAVLLCAVCAAFGTGDASVRRPAKRLGLSAPRQARSFRVEGPVRRRPGAAYAPDRVLVRFRPGVDETYADGLLRSYGFPAVRRIPGIGVYSVKTAARGIGRRRPWPCSAATATSSWPGPTTGPAWPTSPTTPISRATSTRSGTAAAFSTITPYLQYQTTAGADIKAATAWDAAKGDAEIDHRHPRHRRRHDPSRPRRQDRLRRPRLRQRRRRRHGRPLARDARRRDRRRRHEQLRPASPAWPGTAASCRSRSPTRPATASTAGSSTASSGRPTTGPTSSTSASAATHRRPVPQGRLPVRPRQGGRRRGLGRQRRHRRRLLPGRLRRVRPGRGRQRLQRRPRRLLELRPRSRRGRAGRLDPRPGAPVVRRGPAPCPISSPRGRPWPRPTSPAWPRSSGAPSPISRRTTS